MSAEIQDGHPCESCLRWSECNGVDWPACQNPPKTDETITMKIDHACQARLALDVADTLKNRKRRY